MEVVELSFGPEGHDTLRLELGALGRERYYVNQELAYSHCSLMPRGLRQFRHRQHQFTVKVCIGVRAVKGTVHVDGQLLSDDLFSAFNARLAQRRQHRHALREARTGFGRLFVWLSCCLLAFALMKSCLG